MDKTTFNSLVMKTGMKERAVRLANLVLVEGMSPAEAGKKEQVSRQLAEQAARRIFRQQDINHGIPDDWKQVSVSLPNEMALVVEWMYQKSRISAGLMVDATKKVPRLSAATIEMMTDLIAGRAKK